MRVYDKPEFRKRCSLLKNEYKNHMDKIENYCRICFYGSQDKEEDCIHEMLEEMIQAQNCLKPVSMVTNNNLKQYCDEHIKKYQSVNAKLIRVINLLTIYSVFIVLIMFIQQLRNTVNPTLACMYFGPIEMIIVLYALTWSGLRVYITKMFAKRNRMIKNLDVFINIAFILILIPIYNLGFMQSYILQIPTISLIILLVGLVLIKVYVTKSEKKESKTE